MKVNPKDPDNAKKLHRVNATATEPRWIIELNVLEIPRNKPHTKSDNAMLFSMICENLPETLNLLVIAIIKNQL